MAVDLEKRISPEIKIVARHELILAETVPRPDVDGELAAVGPLPDGGYRALVRLEPDVVWIEVKARSAIGGWRVLARQRVFVPPRWYAH